MNAMTVARYVVDTGISQNTPVTNMQLQLILSILRTRYMQEYKRPLFTEAFERRGGFKIVPDVYYMYCHYGVMPITHNSSRPILHPFDEKFLQQSVTELVNCSYYDLMKLQIVSQV